MRAVWRLVALGRAGLPDAASAVTSSFAGFAFFPWGLPCAFPSPLCCCAFGFFSSAIPCFYLSHGFGLLLLPVREEINLALSTWHLAFSIWHLAISQCLRFLPLPKTSIFNSLKCQWLGTCQVLIAKCYQLLLQRGTAVLTYARLAVPVFLMAHPHGTRTRGAHQHHIADGNRALLLGDAALDVLLRVRPHVLLHHHHVLDQHLGLVRHNPEHAAFLALVASGNHPHLIVAADIYTLLHLLKPLSN